MAISYQVESVLADPDTARQRTGMVASPVLVVMLVRQDGRVGLSRRRPEIFRNVAKMLPEKRLRLATLQFLAHYDAPFHGAARVELGWTGLTSWAHRGRLGGCGRTRFVAALGHRRAYTVRQKGRCACTSPCSESSLSPTTTVIAMRSACRLLLVALAAATWQIGAF